MSGPWHPMGRARVSQRTPQAAGVCDRCGLTYSHSDLRWQYQWGGMQLINLRLLVCRRCDDKPQVQLRAIIRPPDPLPIYNARPEQYDEEVPSYMITIPGSPLVTQSGVNLVMMSKITPTPDPNNPYLIPPDF